MTIDKLKYGLRGHKKQNVKQKIKNTCVCVCVNIY